MTQYLGCNVFQVTFENLALIAALRAAIEMGAVSVKSFMVLCFLEYKWLVEGAPRVLRWDYYIIAAWSSSC